ncbi:MAG: hypothetical protein QOH16_2161 [Gaiellaceae bacterium]|nr:hypothetical protein [Gaiellaceae bacterium]
MDAVFGADAAALTAAANERTAHPSLRILFCVWNYYPLPTGGAERQAQLQAEELVRRGHSVCVICPDAEGATSGVVNGVSVRRLRHLRGVPGHKLTYLVSLIWFFVRYGLRYDVVHVHVANLQADAIVLLARALRRPSLVKVASGGSTGEVRTRAASAWWTRRLSLRKPTRVQALSDEIYAELREIGVEPERIVSIPNGLDLKRFRPPSASERDRARTKLGLPRNGVICLFAGRFAHDKGLLELLAAWRAIDQADALLVLAGSYDTPNAIPPIGASSSIKVMPFTHDMPELMRAADIFVYPSHADGMSNAVLEALASGLCVVASTSGATAQIVRDRESGLLIEPGDGIALKACLETVLRDEQKRAAMGAAGHRAASNFGIGRVVDQIEDVYRIICAT